MKIQFFATLFFLTFSLSGNASNGMSLKKEEIRNNSENGALIRSGIFFEDIESELLFVDFEAVGDKISKLNIIKNEELMLEDDVTDLPSNTIYELNLGVFRQGTYTIELVTEQNIQIRKEIIIN